MAATRIMRSETQARSDANVSRRDRSSAVESWVREDSNGKILFSFAMAINRERIRDGVKDPLILSIERHVAMAWKQQFPSAGEWVRTNVEGGTAAIG